MNIFEGLRVYAAQNRIGKLMYDTNGKAYLYHYSNNELQEITIYPIESFRPYVDFSFRGKFREDKFEKWKETFDNIRAYSVQIEVTKNGKKEVLLRYGFISQEGYAITHASYEKVEAFQDGKARVFLDGKICWINKLGHPFMAGKPFDKAEFLFPEYHGFSICSTNGKYGLVNKYGYLCVPCEYDSMVFKNGSLGDIRSVVMEKNGKNYSAIIEGDSVCNIIDFAPKSMELRKKFLVIEEEFTKDENAYTKLGLLNRGGLRILNSEYDSIEIVASNIGIVSKDGYKQLLLIGEKGYQVYIDSCNDIKYGESYDEERQEKYSYASVDERDIVFIEYEDKQGLHSMENNVFRPEDALEYDGAYFDFDGNSNDYIAVVIGDKTKLVDLNGEEIMPLVVPSDCRVLTNTYNEGIVGVSKIIKIEDSEGGYYEKTCYSYINSEGIILTDFIYDGIEKFEGGQANAYYYYPSGGCEKHTIDKNGIVIGHYTDYVEGEPQESNWEEWRDDAFEGDSDAYWNVD